MSKQAKFGTGAQFEAKLEQPLPQSTSREPFRFVVVGKGPTARTKLCMVWVEPEHRSLSGSRSRHRSLQVFSHAHLTEYGDRIDPTIQHPLLFQVGTRTYSVEAKALATNTIVLELALRDHGSDAILATGTIRSRHGYDGRGPVQYWVVDETNSTLVPASTQRYRSDGVEIGIEILGIKAWCAKILGVVDVTFPLLED